MSRTVIDKESAVSIGLMATLVMAAVSFGVMWQKVEYNIELTRENKQAILGLEEKIDQVILLKNQTARLSP